MLKIELKPNHVASAALSSTGALYFSQTARERFIPGNSSLCRLYFAPSRRRLGIELLPHVEPEQTQADARGEGGNGSAVLPARANRVYASAWGMHIAIPSLIKQQGLDIHYGEEFPVEIEECDGMRLIVVDFTKPLPPDPFRLDRLIPALIALASGAPLVAQNQMPSLVDADPTRVTRETPMVEPPSRN